MLKIQVKESLAVVMGSSAQRRKGLLELLFLSAWAHKSIAAKWFGETACKICLSSSYTQIWMLAMSPKCGNERICQVILIREQN